MASFRMDVATNDADEALAFLNDLNSGIEMARSPKDFAFSASVAGDERFSGVLERWTAPGRMRTEQHSAVIVIEVTEGAWDSSAGRSQLDTSRPCLFPPVPAEARWDGAFAVHGTQLDVAELDAAAAAHFGVPGLRVKFSGSSPLTAEREQFWLALTRHVRENVLASDDTLGNDIIRGSAFDLLVAGLLVTFPNNTLELASAANGSAAAPAALRRAIAFMEEHLTEPIGLSDIATAARISPRGLQYAFLRTLGLSPMGYLRRLRLEAVRTELQRADPTSGDTVSSVARRWGFTHLPRFASLYRQQFGENPRETLRR